MTNSDPVTPEGGDTWEQAADFWNQAAARSQAKVERLERALATSRESEAEVRRELAELAPVAPPAHDEPIGLELLRARCDAAEQQLASLREALADARIELDKHGHGDFHYGDRPRDPLVLTVLRKIDAALATAPEDSTKVERIGRIPSHVSPPSDGIVYCTINRQHFRVPCGHYTGAAIRSWHEPPISGDRDLWKTVPGGPDEQYGEVDEFLFDRSGSRWFDAPRFINDSAAQAPEDS